MRKDLRKDFEKIVRIGWNELKRSEKEVFKLYRGNLSLFRQVMAEQFEKYSVDGKLHYDEMSKYNRLPNLFSWITSTIKNLFRAMASILRQTFGDLFEDSYYRTGHLLEIATRTRLGYLAIRKETVEAAVLNPIDKLTLNARLQRNRDQLLMRLREKITMGLVRGSSYKEMVADIKGELESDAVKSRRVIRTEGHRIQSAGVHQAAQHAMARGIKMVKRWLNSKDERVRSDHIYLEEKYADGIPADEEFVNDRTGGHGLVPGQLGVAKDDVNCRCIAIYEVVGVERKQHDDFEETPYDKWRSQRKAA